MIKDWNRGDVVGIKDTAHPEGVCMLTSESALNEPSNWLLMDETCLQWVGTEWVESRSPRLLVRKAAAAAETPNRD